MTDNIKKLTCPACYKEMEKVFIKDRGFHLDICTNGCAGIFFDYEEFKHFDEKHEDISVIEEKTCNKKFRKPKKTKERICPFCSDLMKQNYITGNIEITIDECETCGGKFLDNNELQIIRRHFNHDLAKTKEYDDLIVMKYAKRPNLAIREQQTDLNDANYKEISFEELFAIINKSFE